MLRPGISRILAAAFLPVDNPIAADTDVRRPESLRYFMTPETKAIGHVLHPLSCDWSLRHQYPAFLLLPHWRDWLLDKGSLTARLSALQPGSFNVSVLREYHTRPTPTERRALRLSHQQTVWVREVILRLGDVPLVYARTAVPLATLSGSERRLQSLGNRSLGSYLFRQPSLQRTPLKVCHCRKNHLGLQWARYSLFRLKGKPLLVSEGFSARLNEFI
ncbi:MAG: chorismate--pyruvate lyase [Oceanospirillaceae bacterium]|nr:chorismate--pyruvate lyase [Oceanospirillaceae bacterium]MBT13435.1 chorismate--pyruvate lyase [Oceanospirillaceae bacterium]